MILTPYILSYLFVVSFWISHHTILYQIKKVDRTLLWANIGLFLPISLVPFTTAWQGKFIGEVAPSVCYVGIYTLSVFGLYILGKIASDRVLESKKTECLKENKPRLWLVIFGLIAMIVTFFVPVAATISVFAILIFWLVNTKKKNEY